MISMLRACIACGRLPWRKSERLLCDYCEKFLLKSAQLKCRSSESFDIYSLWEWLSAHSVSGEIVRQLKGGNDSQVVDFFVQIFLEKWFAKNRLFNEKAIFVPAPPREYGKQDHAYILAESFARHTNGEVRALLKRRNLEQQKFRDENERKVQKLEASQLIADSSKLIILVDDVVVTGGTITAGFKALGEPNKFMAWCLADRPRLW